MTAGWKSVFLRKGKSNASEGGKRVILFQLLEVHDPLRAIAAWCARS